MLYKHVIKPLFFLWKPEHVHYFVTTIIKISFKIPLLRWVINNITSVSSTVLEKELFGLHFKNPVGLAAGFDKNGEIINELASLGFGFVEIGAVTPKPQNGNPKPRLFRLPHDKALVNRMGFNNKGVERLVKQLSNKKFNCIVGVNLGKNSDTPNAKAANDYVLLFEKLFNLADYFVVNVSCPNIDNLRELQDKKLLYEILNRIQKINLAKPKSKPVLLKVAPDLNNRQLDDVIEIILETGIAGVIATNTTVKRNNLVSSRNTIQKTGKGGLSGRPLKSRAIEVVKYIAQKSNKAFPIIGVGGIFTASDALEMLDAGADLIQIFTGFIYEGPFIVREINKQLIKAS